MIMALMAVMVMFVGIFGTLRGRVDRIGIHDRRRGLMVAAGGFAVAVIGFGFAVPVGVDRDDVALRADALTGTRDAPRASPSAGNRPGADLESPVPTLPPYPDAIYGADGIAGAVPSPPLGQPADGTTPGPLGGAAGPAGPSAELGDATDQQRPDAPYWSAPYWSAAPGDSGGRGEEQGDDGTAGHGTSSEYGETPGRGGSSGYGRTSGNGGSSGYGGMSGYGGYGGYGGSDGPSGYGGGSGHGGGVSGYRGSPGYGGAGGSTEGRGTGAVSRRGAGAGVPVTAAPTGPAGGPAAGAVGGRGGSGPRPATGSGGVAADRSGGVGTRLGGGAGTGSGGGVGGRSGAPWGRSDFGAGWPPEVRVDLDQPESGPTGGAARAVGGCSAAGGPAPLVVADPFGSGGASCGG